MRTYLRRRGKWLILSMMAIIVLFTGSELMCSMKVTKMEPLQCVDYIRFSTRGDSDQTTKTRLLEKEARHIAFLKVHKAASTTVQNVFLRFGWHRNLTFVLPPAENPYRYPNIISMKESLTNSNILKPPKGRPYDILCNHVLYSKEAFRRIMPNDTVFIGILREPFEMYKSVLNYLKPDYIFRKINASNPASIFLRNPSKYEPKFLFHSVTNNRMAIEFGFPPKLFTDYNQTGIDAYINNLNKEFKLVIISELMDESLVLMRRYLKWNTRDILYVDKNVAGVNYASHLSKAFDSQFYKSYAKIDYALYYFFYKRLKQQICQEGRNFEEELLQFKEVKKMTQEYCKQTEILTPLQIEATRWSGTFSITGADCAEFMLGELDFLEQIRIRQYGSKDI